MLKKILFIVFLGITSLGFSQEKTIEGLSAAPNPFTNSTKIKFSSNNTSIVFFSVKNVLGKTVYRKKVQVKAGKNSIPFYKGKLPVGMYIYSIRSKHKTISKRLVIK